MHARYESYGWQVLTVDWKKTGAYVEDVAELHAAIEAAKAETAKPSLIILKTIIGWPSPGKQNTGKIHGSGSAPTSSRRRRRCSASIPSSTSWSTRP